MAHGKSTVVKAISGVNTVRTKPELERNITIKLGYANAKIYKCEPAEDGVPGNYRCVPFAPLWWCWSWHGMGWAWIVMRGLD